MAAMNNSFSINQLNNEILKFFDFFTKINNETKNKRTNCLFDVLSITNVINILFLGLNSETKIKIKKDSMLTDLLKYVPKPTSRRVGIFLRNPMVFEQSYAKKIAKLNVYIANLPSNEVIRHDMNKSISRFFPDWPEPEEEFFPFLLSPNIRLYIKDQSDFHGIWEKRFKSWDTKLGAFHVGPNKTIKVDMMVMKNDDENLLTYHYRNELENSMFVSMPYKDKKHSMLIIMPEKPSSKNDLINLVVNHLTAEIISDFYYNKGEFVEYQYKTMPKFSFESQWNLSSNDSKLVNIDKNCCPYMNTIFNNNVDLTNICESLSSKSREGMELVSISKVENKEDGTFIKTETQLFETDGHYDVPENLKKLIIDKSFIFIIVNKDKFICDIGIFAG